MQSARWLCFVVKRTIIALEPALIDSTENIQFKFRRCVKSTLVTIAFSECPFAIVRADARLEDSGNYSCLMQQLDPPLEQYHSAVVNVLGKKSGVKF